mgnify:FL=1
MITHKIKLYGYTAELVGESQLVLGTVDSYGIERIQLTLGPEWAGLVITATFTPPKGRKAVKVVVDSSGLFDVPQEATALSGQGTITFAGNTSGQQRISVDVPYVVANHAAVDGVTPDPTPSEWAQFVAQVQQARDDAEAAAQAAEASQTAAAGSADAAAESAKQAAQATADIGESKDDALEAIQQAQDTGVQAVQTATTAGVQVIQQSHQAALDDIATDRQQALTDIETEGEKQTSAITSSGAAALEAIGQVEQTVIGQVQQAGQESIASAQQEAEKAAYSATLAGESASAAKGSEGAAAASAAAAAASKINAEDAAGRAEQAAQNSGLPQPTNADAGKVPTVNDAGTGYELRSTLEKNISDYYAMRRTGKVYQTRLWKFVANPTSAGEKLLDNAGLVFEPSTDTEEGPDDYLNGQNPLFEWVNVNYIRDDDGAPRPTAIEGQAGFKTSGAVDVGTMQMSFWYKIDASGEDYIDYYVSDTPHPELGLVPWPECVKADGTVLPWCIGSKDISGEASDGLPRSQPGLKPIRNVSHNLMITAYQQKGPGYWGAGAVRNTFQILFNAIKGATKSSQALYAGCTNYNYQYEAAVQSEDAHTYFPVTNAQAANLVVGSYVSVGYGSNNNGAVNRDRGQASVHAYADDVKILSIETLDDNNMAVYLDIPEESAFNTMPHVHTETLSAPIILSTMPWWSGATDAVKGRHDGSPGSNTNGKYPYRVQGREYAVGGYVVASDTVAWLNEDGARTVYAAPRGTAHSPNPETIQSTYRQIGTIPLNSSGSVADYWVGDAGIDEDTGVWHPSAQGSGSAQGCADMYYAGGDAANLFREYLQCGNLWFGSGAGSCYLNLWYWLGYGNWIFLAGD